MGRPPLEKPRNVLINFRIDEETAAALDAELVVELRPGLTLSRNDMVRMLMAEALAARAQRRQKRPK